MREFPYELLHLIFARLPLYQLLQKIKRVCRSWNAVAQHVTEARLKGCLALLHDIGHAVPSTGIPNLFEIEAMETHGAAGETVSPFKAWLLCNLEYSSDSNVITAIEVSLDGYHLASGHLTFRPTGLASFGMWVDYVGFFPITTPYSLSQFSFPPSIQPQFRLWCHVDAKIVANAPTLLNQPNATYLLPQTRTNIQKELGQWQLCLHDQLGQVGCLSYQIITPESELGVVSSLPPSLRGSELVLHHLEQDTKKVVGEINALYINPQALLSFPI
ncbi:hypothetical protein HDU91_000023 [Kappamyces sp. JEL0680]|nr:hypothetical protein HDU91_000023 [Kappamyces sp. JEL0680]